MPKQEDLIPEATPVPTPGDWARLHELLRQAWEAGGSHDIPKPPVPLILAGAAFSTAAAIRQRWRDLVAWANDHGFSQLLAAHLPSPPENDVADQIAGVSADGRGWWTEYGEQVHERKVKPTKEALAAALATLKLRWPQIVGDLSQVCRPNKFSGRKSRRLVVSANPAANPPWGSWYSAKSDPRAFSSFRRAVNQAIAPLEVDDVSFVTDHWGAE